MHYHYNINQNYMFVRQMQGHIVNPSRKLKRPYEDKHLKREISNERFSSFQTPPPSDEELQQFSYLDNTPTGAPSREKQQVQDKKQKSNILVEQMPVKYDEKRSGRTAKKGPLNQSKDSNKSSISVKSDRCQSVGSNSILKETHPSRFNYIKNAQKQLSIINQDLRQQLKSSSFSSCGPSSHFSQLRHQQQLQILPHSLPPIPAIPKFRYYDDLIEADAHYSSLVQMEEQRLLLEQMRIRNIFLQKQNVGLRERIYQMEFQAKRKDEQQQFKKQADMIADKIARVSLQEEAHSSRKEVKQKLLDQIASIQHRCKEMKEEMNEYKARQEEQSRKLFLEKEELVLQNQILTTKNEYNIKFMEVFMSMIHKLPLKLESHWSDKKKIAIGWKMVKHLVKKALKLGVQLPTVVESSDLH